MSKHYTYSPGIVYKNKMHDDITADVLVADATPVLVAGARSVGIAFKENGTVNNRSGVLTLWGSMDGGTTYVQLNMLITNATNAITEGVVRVASITRAAAGTDFLIIDPLILQCLTHIKAQVDITDGGSPTGSFDVDAVIAY